LNAQEKIKIIDQLYQKYNNDVYQFIYFMIRDRDTALDLMQDTFIRSFERLEQFKGINEKSWLIKIARNRTIDYIRKKKPLLFYNEQNVDRIDDNSPEIIAILNENERELYRALNKLKRTYQEVIILRKINDFSIKETAEILDWNEQKVKNNLYQAMKSLKSDLIKGGYHDGA